MMIVKKKKNQHRATIAYTKMQVEKESRSIKKLRNLTNLHKYFKTSKEWTLELTVVWDQDVITRRLKVIENALSVEAQFTTSLPMKQLS